MVPYYLAPESRRLLVLVVRGIYTGPVAIRVGCKDGAAKRIIEGGKAAQSEANDSPSCPTNSTS